MKRNILLIIVFSTAFLLLQCQHAKNVIKDLKDLPAKGESKEKTDDSEDNRNVFSSSSEIQSSSSGSSSSGSETLRKRKEAN
jgi:hypothetical protein